MLTFLIPLDAHPFPSHMFQMFFGFSKIHSNEHFPAVLYLIQDMSFRSQRAQKYDITSELPLQKLVTSCSATKRIFAKLNNVLLP